VRPVTYGSLWDERLPSASQAANPGSFAVASVRVLQPPGQRVREIAWRQLGGRGDT